MSMTTKFTIWAVGLGITVAAIGFGLFAAYESGYDAAELEGQLAMAKLEKNLAGQVVKYKEKADDADEKNRLNVAKLTQQGSDNAEKIRQTAQSTIDAYVSDNKRLRKQLGGTSANQGGASAGTTTGLGQNGSVETIGLRRPDVEFLVRFGSEANLARNALKACVATAEQNEALFDEWYNKEGTLSVQ